MDMYFYICFLFLSDDHISLNISNVLNLDNNFSSAYLYLRFGNNFLRNISLRDL